MTASGPTLRIVAIYGLSLAGLVFLLKFIEYRFLINDLSLEFYLGLTAVFFTSLGIWAGLRLVRKKTVIVSPGFRLNEATMQRLGISAREREVLEKMALGLSNQEIADQLFVSLNTIKTHTASLYGKLDARRRTEALRKARELELIPW